MMPSTDGRRPVVLYSDKERLHAPDEEWNFGKIIPYPEKRERGTNVVGEMRRCGYGDMLVETREYDVAFIKAVHDDRMVEHIRSCRELDDGEAVYPHIFPYRRDSPHLETDMRSAGYFCFDVGTSVTRNTFTSAKAAVDVALDGAHRLLAGEQRAVFALCRPPGHHADHAAYGGYCYFNNAAVASHVLAEHGKVAVLDLDFHHGNGTQGIFYLVSNVLYVSLHGDPRWSYPYFTGFEEERGAHLGEGFNVNIPLPRDVQMTAYREYLDLATRRIDDFSPAYLVVSMGFDTFEKDPLGELRLLSNDYAGIGRLLSDLGPPVLACLEGGYDMDDLGVNAVRFLEGLYDIA
jgi:acetoin utilization deacetylase AcuC-like enzyme